MEDYKRALAEVNIIITNMPKELAIKIPDKFKNVVKQEMDSNYNPDINKLIIEKDILQETVVILGLIYRDFLCSYSEREKLQIQDKNELQKIITEESKKQFTYDTLFQKHVPKEELQLITTNKKWYESIIDYFRRIVFRHNKY